MKKKRLVLFLALVLTLSLALCACGDTFQGEGEPSHEGGKGEVNAPYENDPENYKSQIEESRLSEENVVGTGWQCTYFEEDGDKVYRRFTLSAEKEFQGLVAINELFSHRETGTYEVKDGKLYLYLNGDQGASSVYEYKNGMLVNDGNEYITYKE